MLESLEQSNIKRMSVEKPEDTAGQFDPMQEFTEQKWQKLSAASSVFEQRNAPISAGMAADIKFLNPDLKIDMTSKADWEARIKRLKESVSSNLIIPRDTADLISLIVSGRELGLDAESVKLNQHEQTTALATLDLFRRDNNWLEFVPLAANLKRLGIEFSAITILDRQGIKESFDHWLPTPVWFVKSGFFWDCQSLMPDADFKLSQGRYDQGVKLLREPSKDLSELGMVELSRLLVETKPQPKKLADSASVIPEQRNF